MRTLICLCPLTLLLLVGCPSPTPQSPVTADITIDTTQGDPPLTVAVSAAGSSSTNAGELQFEWDFGGEATADTETATHTFESPGLYRVILRVTDAQGEQDTASVDVRVRGATPVAVIEVDVDSGPANLFVRFDGSESYSVDDVIRDYLWDFGDGSAESTDPDPAHVFTTPGTYTVTLTVRTAGGVEASTTIDITVTAPLRASLQFAGNELATLSLGTQQTLTDWTFEAWFKVAATGGGPLVATPDGTFSLQIRPDYDAIRLEIVGQIFETTITNLSGTWLHVAVVNQAGSEAAVYLDATALGSTSAADQLTTGQLDLGVSFLGKVAEVRWWSAARTVNQIADNYNQRLTSAGATLLGYWRLDEGEGQYLENDGTSGVLGVLGASAAVEAADPAWSVDGPDLD